VIIIFFNSCTHRSLGNSFRTDHIHWIGMCCRNLCLRWDSKGNRKSECHMSICWSIYCSD